MRKIKTRNMPTMCIILLCGCSPQNGDELEYNEIIIEHVQNSQSVSRYQMVYDESEKAIFLGISQQHPLQGTLSIRKIYSDKQWLLVTSELENSLTKESYGASEECRTYYPYYKGLYYDEYTLCSASFDSPIDQRLKDVFDSGQLISNTLNSKSDFEL